MGWVAAAGTVAWVALMVWTPAPSGDLLRRIGLILLLAILIVVPLLLPLIGPLGPRGMATRALRAAIVFHPIGAAAAAASICLPTGAAAVLLAAPWAAFTGLVALSGLARLRPRGLIAAEEVAMDLGCVYLPVGALWLLASRAGIAPLGFGEPITILTAVHFHFAGFAAPVLAGLAGRILLGRSPAARGIFAPVAAAIVMGMPLVAAGITISPLVEAAGVAVFTLGLLGLAVLILGGIVPHAGGFVPGTLFSLSGLSLIAAMAFAATYGLSEFVRADWISIPRMVEVHGWTNGIGFALLGALAHTIRRPPGPGRTSSPPFSGLASRGRVGPDFFQRTGAVVAGSPEAARPRGLMDRLDDYRRPGFDPDGVHRDLRAFYEETASFGLIVRPHWASGFRLASRIYKRLAAWIGQMNFPVSGALHEDRIDSAILPIDDALDGRRSVRAWVRTYAETGEAIYVAAYANHTRGPVTYMNIAFPLPGGNLASILRIEAAPGDAARGGIVLTTLPGPERAGDEGVYFANGLLPVRLPMNETIQVWPAGAGPEEAIGDPGEEKKGGSGERISILARHDMWLFGLRFLTLRYEIFRREPERDPVDAGGGG